MKCICCDSNHIKKKFKKNSYQIFECTNCKFQFVHPTPSEETIEKFYNQTRVNTNIRDQIKTYIQDLDHNPNHPKRDWFDKILTLSSSYTSKTSMDILEVGSAYGYFVDYSNKKGHNAVGVEVSEEYAHSSKGLINGEVHYLKPSEYIPYFEGRKFDLIYLEHVFEHVLDPMELLENIKPLLNPHGLIILIVPNHNSLLSKIYRKYYKWTNPPDHLYFYNETALKILTKNSGLHMNDLWTDDYYHRSIYQFYSLDFFIHNFKRVINKLFGTSLSTKHSYKYPRKIKDLLTLLPYFIMYPIIKYLNNKYRLGNELVITLSNESTTK